MEILCNFIKRKLWLGDLNHSNLKTVLPKLYKVFYSVICNIGLWMLQHHNKAMGWRWLLKNSKLKQYTSISSAFVAEHQRSKSKCFLIRGQSSRAMYCLEYHMCTGHMAWHRTIRDGAMLYHSCDWCLCQTSLKTYLLALRSAPINNHISSNWGFPVTRTLELSGKTISECD